MPVVEPTMVFNSTEMRIAGIYASFQSKGTPGTNVLNSRRVRSLSKDGENYDQEEVQNIVDLERFKNYMACQGDPGTLTLGMYFDPRKQAILPPNEDMTSSFAGIGQGTLYLAYLTNNSGSYSASTFFECDANIQSANSIGGEAGKPSDMQVVFKLTGTPTYYVVGPNDA